MSYFTVPSIISHACFSYQPMQNNKAKLYTSDSDGKCLNLRKEHKSTLFYSSTNQSGIIVHLYNTTMWEAEAKRTVSLKPDQVSKKAELSSKSKSTNILISFWLRFLGWKIRNQWNLPHSLSRKPSPSPTRATCRKNRHILKVDTEHLTSPETKKASDCYQIFFHSVLWNTPVNLTRDNYYCQQLFICCLKVFDCWVLG